MNILPLQLPSYPETLQGIFISIMEMVTISKQSFEDIIHCTKLLMRLLQEKYEQPNDQSTHEELQRVIQATEYMGKVFEQVQKNIEKH